ncbi:MAG TPA: PEP/pyruvate-binding domain-containing protein [Actinomycetota bacterium]|nr:PEP/pyruvate-binding domain-containing protein [Actinomycetota bacterium]
MSSAYGHVLWLEECGAGADAVPLVGGKAVGLGHLVRRGHRVPPGFAVTTAAYREALGAGGRPATVGDHLAAELVAAYRRLGRAGDQDAPVAVRSSATAEDTAEASFAGQQDTYLWVRGADAVLAHVSRCWASLFTDRAVAYRARLGIGDDEVAMGVVVQAMVPAEAAGVLLTLDPLTGDRSQVTIEAAYGLGTAVVEGEVTPDRFAVDKVTLELRSRSIGEKAFAYRFDPAAGRVARVEVPAADRARPCLDDAEAAELARLGKRIEQALGAPQDVEWAIGPLGSGAAGGREPWLLQARPETVWSRRPRQAVVPPGTSTMDRMLAYLGRPGAPGQAGPD